VRFVEIKRSDTEVLTFLLTYLLPLVASPSLGMGSRAAGHPLRLLRDRPLRLPRRRLHLQPVLGCFGYHFYEVKLESGAALC